MSELVKNLVDRFGYAAILFFSFLENIIPPIPSEVILPLGGFLAASGELTLGGVAAAGTAGSVLGSIPLYYLGKRLGEWRVRKMVDYYGKWLGISGKDIDKAQAWLRRHGYKAVFLCRMVPGVRSLISIPAGFCEMRFVPFMLYTTVGTAIWTTLLVVCGWFLGEHYERVDEFLGPVSYIVLAAAVLVGGTWLVLRIRKSRRAAAFQQD